MTGPTRQQTGGWKGVELNLTKKSFDDIGMISKMLKILIVAGQHKYFEPIQLKLKTMTRKKMYISNMYFFLFIQQYTFPR